MSAKNCPVIFLAFANDRVDEAAYLRNLPKELDGIRKALYRAQEAELCEVVERANITVNEILNVFQDQNYRDRIAVFHYGGHANGYQLLLESASGGNVSAKSEGLVPFLARQQSLKLVFLNGCSSQQQALELIHAGLPAVIGTSQSINDDVATSLAIRFYYGLGNGAGIDKAWQEAIDEIKIQKGTANMRDLFWDGMETLTNTEEQNLNSPSHSINIDRFPWEIHYKQGAEIVKEWNLPEQVGNPLFNLPEIPKRHNLPESPFLFLKRYERKHARVFFGRSYYVRELYNKITDLGSPPIILLYGQTGVGKSSLFDAGIYPRLEETYLIEYHRRDGNIGLVEGLKQVLDEKLKELTAEPIPLKVEQPTHADEEVKLDHQGLADLLTSLKAQLPEMKGAIKEQTQKLIAALQQKSEAHALETHLGNDKSLRIAKESEIQHLKGILKQWRTIEARANKPLVLILDQVEELFTRPIETQPNELNNLLQLFRELFANPIDFPQGKIILGYRKEYNPEIEAGFKQYSLPRTKVFLEHLTRKDIIDVFYSLAGNPALKERYNLTIEEQLPVIVADDLLEDKNSSVAPVLQILLTKMWEKAKLANPDAPVFTVDLYQNLRREGILLDDFYFQQMEKLRTWAEEMEVSGFALSVLQFHTTRLATAGSRHIDELLERYKHRKEDITLLIEKFKELYLLNELGKNITGLAHDTIAPLIQNQYRMSERPGQRAARVLDNKSAEFKNNPKTSLDVSELILVESGQAGMRYWADREWKLVEKSRVLREKRKKGQRLLLRAGFIVVSLVLMGFLFGIDQAWRAKKLVRDKAISSLGEKSKIALEKNPTFALVMAKAFYDETNRLSAEPPQNEAYNTNSVGDNTQLKLAESYLKSAIVGASGRKLYHSTLSLDKGRYIQNLDFSDDEELVITTSNDNVMTIWDIDGNLIDDLHRSIRDIDIVSFCKDSLVLVYKDGDTRVMDKQGDTYRTGELGNIKTMWESANKTVRVLINTDDIFDIGLGSDDYCKRTKIFFSNFHKNIHFSVDLADFPEEEGLKVCAIKGAKEDGSLIAFQAEGAVDSFGLPTKTWVSILNTETKELTRLPQFEGRSPAFLFHPTKPYIGLVLEQRFYLLDEAFQEISTFELDQDDGFGISYFSFNPEKDLILFIKNTGDGAIYNYTGEKLYNLPQDGGSISFGFSPKGRYCYQIGNWAKVYLWDLEADVLTVPDWGSEGWITKFERVRSNNARFSVDGKKIIDQNPKGGIEVWDWKSNTLVEELPMLGDTTPKALFYMGEGNYGELTLTQGILIKKQKRPQTNFRLDGSIQVVYALENGQLIVANTDLAVLLDANGNILKRVQLTAWSDEPESTTMNISIGNELLAIQRDNKIEIYNLKSGRVINTFQCNYLNKMALSKNDQFIAFLDGYELSIREVSSTKFIDSFQTQTFSSVNDIRFAEDNQHVLLCTDKGVYSWGSIELLFNLIEPFQLDKPALLKEVSVLLNDNQVIRGTDDPLIKKGLFFFFIFLTLAFILLNQTTHQFDDQQYIKVLFYGSAFGLLVFAQLATFYNMNTRMAVNDFFNNFMLLNLPYFCFMNFMWYRKLKDKAANSAYVYLGLILIGLLGAAIYTYYEYFAYFKLDFLSTYLLLNAILIPILIPAHVAVKSWYKGKKVRFWIFAVIYAMILLLYAFYFVKI